MKIKTVLENDEGVFLGEIEYTDNAEEITLIIGEEPNEKKVTLSAKVKPL